MAYNNRSDARFSTYSGAPSIQPSLAPTLDSQPTSNRSSTQPMRQSYLAAQSMSEKQHPVYGSTNSAMQASASTIASNDPKMQDIRNWTAGMERMQDERLERQRYVMSGTKSEEVGKIALGAKVERALGRRMTGQDATFTKKIGNEKPSQVRVQ